MFQHFSNVCPWGGRGNRHIWVHSPLIGASTQKYTTLISVGLSTNCFISVKVTQHPFLPFDQGNLGAPIVKGSWDEDFLASVSPADDSGTSLLGWLDWLIQVMLPWHKILFPRQLQEEGELFARLVYLGESYTTVVIWITKKNPTEKKNAVINAHKKIAYVPVLY